MYRRVGTGLVLVGLLIWFCIQAIWPPSEKIKLGLDLKGGTLLQYRLDLSNVPVSQRSSVVDEVKTIIYRRLDRFGLKEIEVRRVGRDRIQVAIPGVAQEEVEGIKTQIEQAGQLSFHLVKKVNPPQDELQKVQRKEREYQAQLTEWVAKGAPEAEKPPEPTEIARPEYKKDPRTREVVINPKTKQPVIGTWYILGNTPEERVSGRYISSAQAAPDPQTGGWMVTFSFRPEGARQFGALTKANIKKQLAVVLDRVVVTAPVIKSAIFDRGQITGNFREREARALANILSVGSLPTKPILTQEQTIGARLGHDSIVRGKTSVAIGFLVVVVFMAIYYMKAGLIADFALFFNLILILAYVATFGQSLSFPGIAGVLLTVGMAVDANILIFERIREELKKGKPLEPSVAAGFDRAFWTIFDANATTFITGLVLFKVGSGPVQGFAITLMAGLAANFLTALYVSRLFMSVLYKLGLLKRLRMLQLFETPNIQFLKHSRKAITVSILLIGTGLAVLFARGPEVVGIDFRGGMEIALNLSKPLEIDEFRKKLSQIEENGIQLFADAQVQATSSTEGGLSHGFIIRVPFKKFMSHGFQTKPKVASLQREVRYAALFAAPAANPAKAAQKSPEGKKQKQEPVEPEKKAPQKTPAAEKTAPAGGTKGAGKEAPTESPAPPSVTPPGQAAPSAAQSSQTVEEGVITEQVRELYRKSLEKTFADVLAPEPFGASGDRPYELNPDLGRIVYLQVNIFRGDSPDTDVLEFAKKIPQLFQEYLEEVSKEAEKNPNLPAVRKFAIAQVKVLPEQKYSAYVTYQVETEPIKYGTGDSPIGVHETVTQLKRFFISDFYQRRLADPDMQPYRNFFIAERISRISQVDSAVAADFQGAAMMAILVSLLAIVFYIGIRFELTFGFGAVVALIHDVLFGLGALAVADYLFGDFLAVKIDLPVVAAFLTIIGYSLNDTIVVFDRIRENTKKVKKYNLTEVVNTSINQTLNRTLLTSLTTFVVVLILLLGGGPTVQGFAFVMLVGVVVGTYSSVFIASPSMIYLSERRARKREARLSGAPRQPAKAGR